MLIIIARVPPPHPQTMRVDMGEKAPATAPSAAPSSADRNRQQMPRTQSWLVRRTQRVSILCRRAAGLRSSRWPQLPQTTLRTPF